MMRTRKLLFNDTHGVWGGDGRGSIGSSPKRQPGCLEQKVIYIGVLYMCLYVIWMRINYTRY